MLAAICSYNQPFLHSYNVHHLQIPLDPTSTQSEKQHSKTPVANHFLFYHIWSLVIFYMLKIAVRHQNSWHPPVRDLVAN